MSLLTHSLTTCHLRGTRIFLENPRMFLENPRIFLENPRIFLENPRIFLENPTIFLENPRIFLENHRLHLGRLEKLHSIKDCSGRVGLGGCTGGVSSYDFLGFPRKS